MTLKITVSILDGPIKILTTLNIVEIVKKWVSLLSTYKKIHTTETFLLSTEHSIPHILRKKSK